MPATKSIPGIQKGPDFDSEVYEPARVEKVIEEIKHQRPVEANDTVVAAAIESVKEAADSIGRKIDVQFDRSTGRVVFTVYSSDGEKVIRRVPPEEAIRMAQRMKNQRAQYLDNIF